MPKGPRCEKRPADVIGNAVKVMRIATGEEEETISNEAKRHAGEAGARNRAMKLTPEQRSEIARAAAESRWKKGKR
jgi:hypothetical protein